jgi:hypothetical protein
MNLTINNSNVIPDSVEKNILELLDLGPPLCYGEISENEKKGILKKIIRNPQYEKYSINYEQVKSIKSSYIKNKMIKRHPILLSRSKQIIRDYNNKLGVMNISKKYDGSPLNIMRIILGKSNSKEKVKKIFNNPKLLSDYDYEQFQLAKSNDIYALVDQKEIQNHSLDFEKKIQKYLESIDVQFKTQEELVKEQMKLYGKPINTPDFLITSDLIINNKKINWIDAKNFYGSNISFVKKKIVEQTKKYLNTWGSGCIIFNLGFNSIYLDMDPQILFLSFDSL